MFEQDLRTLSHVARWGTVRRLRDQNVAEHSYFVTVYAVQIANRVGWKGDMAELMQWALVHDAPECFSGDIQGPTKRAVVDPDRMVAFEIAEMERRFPRSFLGEYIANQDVVHNDVKRIVKCADIADEAAYLAIEMSMGNASVEDVYQLNVFPRLQAAWLALPTDGKVDLQMVWNTEVRPTFEDMITCNTRHMIKRV